MPFEQPSGEFLQITDEHRAVYAQYAALAAAAPLDREAGLGGKLVFAGDLAAGSRLLRAANIAGAASLAASAGAAVQRQAIREGVVDFLVTSLEEALRILKNEIRKRQTVSVAVALEPRELVRQMLDRGVLPDLLAAAGSAGEGTEAFIAQGACHLASSENDEERYMTWAVDRDFLRWLPRIDACAAGLISTEDVVRQRWLRLAPRYLGRLAQRRHGVALGSAEVAEVREYVRGLLAEGDAPVIQVDSVAVS
jgi:urocanase-like protein